LGKIKGYFHAVNYKLDPVMLSFNIAHCPSTTRHADEIIVLKKVEIVERGTHDELLALNGVYKRLQDMQSYE
jgi:subfamily B ATP-binding cassette protein MsbA